MQLKDETYKKIRNSLVENIFYSTDQIKLKAFKLEEEKTYDALLVGYENYEFFLKNSNLFKKVISNKTNNIFIMSETKTDCLINISNHKIWKFFDKNIEVNFEIINFIKTFKFTNTDNKLIEDDHKIEIISNFICNIKKNIKIVPIIFGKPNKKDLIEFCKFLKKNTTQKENSFIFLSYFISKSTNLEKALKMAKNLKTFLLEKNLNPSIILESYNAKKIFPENINAIITINQIFKEFEFSNSTIIKNSTEYLILDNILMK